MNQEIERHDAQKHRSTVEQFVGEQRSHKSAMIPHQTRTEAYVLDARDRWLHEDKLGSQKLVRARGIHESPIRSPLLTSADSKRQFLLKSLSMYNHVQYYKSLSRDRLSGTGDSLSSYLDYQSWKGSIKSMVLLCSGIRKPLSLSLFSFCQLNSY